MIEIKLEGMSELLKGVKAYELQMRGRVSYAIEAGMIRIRDDAKGYAPVRKKQGGNLRNSIRGEMLSPLTAVVETNVVYAARQEFGFIGTDKLGRTYNQQGRLYMTRAAEENTERLLAGIRREIERI